MEDLAYLERIALFPVKDVFPFLVDHLGMVEAIASWSESHGAFVIDHLISVFHKGGSFLGEPSHQYSLNIYIDFAYI